MGPEKLSILGSLGGPRRVQDGSGRGLDQNGKMTFFETEEKSDGKKSESVAMGVRSVLARLETGSCGMEVGFSGGVGGGPDAS